MAAELGAQIVSCVKASPEKFSITLRQWLMEKQDPFFFFTQNAKET